MNRFQPSVYDCPVCGKRRGGKVGRGEHVACYRIMQKQQAEKNEKLARRRATREPAVKKRYASGKTILGVFE